MTLKNEYFIFFVYLRYFEALNNQNDVAAHISLEYNKQGFC
jgi:hypothetical protein